MRTIYSCLLIAIALTGTQQCYAQYGTFGEDTCPEDSAAVDDIIYYGELLDILVEVSKLEAVNEILPELQL